MMVIINDEQIQVPEKLHGWYPVKVLPLEFLNSEYARRHRRLSVFAFKGVKCSVPNCKHEGAFLMECEQRSNKTGKVQGIHIDLYTKDFALMTVDHHIALANGGNDHLDNKFPMCSKHNGKKGKLPPEIFYEKFGKL
jgi:5-methylcytosine-specific restriction endonuclease McrA